MKTSSSLDKVSISKYSARLLKIFQFCIFVVEFKKKKLGEEGRAEFFIKNFKV